MKVKYFFSDYIFQKTSIAPLITFRILFGLMMLFSALRFMHKGWIDTHFADNKRVFFHYYGFDWVNTLSTNTMYIVHSILILAALGIAVGAFYRIFSLVFFLLFTYCELIDSTYYLNHYYFISITSFLLIFVPANRFFSFDSTILKLCPKQNYVSNWTVGILKLQIGIVYFYAGLAKINPDWLFSAMPLKLWLPANNNLWMVGKYLNQPLFAYLFSWGGMFYDLFIPFMLLYARTRIFAYILVVLFHSIVGILFPIGVFPLVMMLSALIFFSDKFHETIYDFFIKNSSDLKKTSNQQVYPYKIWVQSALFFYFSFQILFPFRYLFYDGNLFWTEQGFRFSWRVMLMEKAGTATFFVKNQETGYETMIDNSEFLSPLQEKQMSFQPDLILQYAHFLQKYYQKKGIKLLKVRAEVYVTLNARPSQLYFNPQLDLCQIQDSWENKTWIYPLSE